MAEPFLGEVRLFGFGFAPKDWAACDGQKMLVQKNTALFSLIGVQLPNFQRFLPVGAGQRSGLSSYVQGQTGGETTVTLNTGQTAQTAQHTHALAPVGSGQSHNNMMPSPATQFVIALSAYSHPVAERKLCRATPRLSLKPKKEQLWQNHFSQKSGS